MRKPPGARKGGYYGTEAAGCKPFCAAQRMGRAGVLAVALLAGGVLAQGFGGAAAQPATILAFGDSLTAGFGLAPGRGFPARLEAALRERGLDVRVVDAGVSGDTTAGGRARLDWALTPEVDAVILELGANDALRGVDPARTRANLDDMIRRFKAHNVPVLLSGMLAPPNMGAAYGKAFNGIYPELARTHDLVFHPFFLDGVAGDPALNLEDGIHPTAEGIDIIVERILPYVTQLLAAVRTP